MAAQTAPSESRDDVARAYQDERFKLSGWRCAFPLAAHTAGASLEVSAVSSSGVSRTLLFYPQPAAREGRDITIQVQPVVEPEESRGFLRRFLKRCAASLAYRFRAMMGGV